MKTQEKHFHDKGRSRALVVTKTKVIPWVQYRHTIWKARMRATGPTALCKGNQNHTIIVK